MIEFRGVSRHRLLSHGSLAASAALEVGAPNAARAALPPFLAGEEDCIR